MAAKDRLSKAGQTARAAGNNPYLRRLMEDDDLRSNLKSAYAATRNAYGRFNNGKTPSKALFEDKKLQKELREAANSLRGASASLKAAPKKRRGGIGRAILLLGVGGMLAVALSEGLRSKVLDMLFGAEEEFDYTSTTAPPVPAPTPAADTVASD